MIVNMERFMAAEQPAWKELEGILDRMEADPDLHLDLQEVLRFQELYQRASAGLGDLAALAVEPGIRSYLEALVSRAYSEIHETRSGLRENAFRRFLFTDFPRAFRRHSVAAGIATAVTLAAAGMGGMAVQADPAARRALMPFSELLVDPRDRVAREEAKLSDPLEDAKGRFAASLMANNIRVALFALALGATWGIGTLIVLFYNGLILGAVAADYLAAGQARFLLGWLLPHGVVEIPAILIGAQAGLVLAAALIRRGREGGGRDALRDARTDLVLLGGGAAVMLVWAGLVEAFFSQYHEPFLPYEVKIAVGAVELAVVSLWLTRGGRMRAQEGGPDA